jgi:hypothetical protein
MTKQASTFNRSELPFIRNVERPAASLGPQARSAPALDLLPKVWRLSTLERGPFEYQDAPITRRS